MKELFVAQMSVHVSHRMRVVQVESLQTPRFDAQVTCEVLHSARSGEPSSVLCQTGEITLIPKGASGVRRLCAVSQPTLPVRTVKLFAKSTLLHRIYRSGNRRV